MNSLPEMTSGWSGTRYAGIPAGAVTPIGTMEPGIVPRSTDYSAHTGKGWPSTHSGLPPPPVPPADDVPFPGFAYFLNRGRNDVSFGSLSDNALYESGGAAAVPLACAPNVKEAGCGVPPMEFCRTLECPRSTAPFRGGCVAPLPP